MKKSVDRSSSKRAKQRYFPISINGFGVDSPEYWELTKRLFAKNYYKDRSYIDEPLQLNVTNELGIEEDKNYFKIIAQMLNAKCPSDITIDLRKCERLWPSGVILLVSLRHWVNLTASYPHPKVRVLWTPNTDLADYLKHCGFEAYVSGQNILTPTDKFSDDDIIKITRQSPGEANKTRRSIKELLARKSGLTSDQLELFNSTVLAEIIINVEEHGLLTTDGNWFSICQLHKNHEFISLCIADNGLGIRNSLLTGPQREYFDRYSSESDDFFIAEALKEDISGATTASIKTRTGLLMRSRFQKGSRRGNGLGNILQNCQALGIEISIVSGQGMVHISRNGAIEKLSGVPGGKIFAGTMFHLKIPVGKISGDKSDRNS